MEPHKRSSYYRPYLHPLTSTPFSVRSCGHYVIDPPYLEPEKEKDFFELFWVLEGCCTFMHSNQRHDLTPGWVFFYLPGDIHKIQVSKVHTEYVWMTLDGEKLHLILNLFELSSGSRYAGTCPFKTFTKLFSSMRDLSAINESETGKIAYSILSDATQGTSEEGDLADQFKIMVREHLSENTLSVGSIAEKLQIHRTTLHRAVLNSLGTGPKQYILKCRVQEAISMILDSKRSFKEIAQECGFEEQNYFSKVIRAHIGKPPGELRKTRIF